MRSEDQKIRFIYPTLKINWHVGNLFLIGKNKNYYKIKTTGTEFNNISEQTIRGLRLFQTSEMQGSKVSTGWSFNHSENTKTVTINYDGHHQVHSFAAHIYSHDEVCLRGI